MELRWSWASHKPFTDGGVFSVASSVLNVLACWHFFLFLLPPNNKCFNQTFPSDKPEKQGVVRNQLVVPRWSDGSETTKKTNQHALPSSNLPFRWKLRNRTWSLWTFAQSERRTSRTRRISPPQSLARSATPPLRLLVAELAWSRWDRDMRTANMRVTTLGNTLAPKPCVTIGIKGEPTLANEM